MDEPKTADVKLRINGITPQTRAIYRLLRCAGVERHNANMVIWGTVWSSDLWELQVIDGG